MPIDPTKENLFTPSAIKLFGREFDGLTVARPFSPENQNPLGRRARVPTPQARQDALTDIQGYEQEPGRLERSLRKTAWDEAQANSYSRFARIYAFAYEGQYYELPRPILYLVRGPGKHPQNPDNHTHFTVSQAGIAARDWQFASDIRMWEADDKDMSMCIDIESGTMKEILLQPVFEIEEDMAMRGAAVSRGAAASRGAAVARGAAASRGAAVARGAAMSRDPHRNR